jgi:hypothetical protein
VSALGIVGFILAIIGIGLTIYFVVKGITGGKKQDERVQSGVKSPLM